MPWEARCKSVHAMPGGSESYLESLRWIGTSIGNRRVSRAELKTEIIGRFSISPSYASEIVKLLLKLEFIQDHSGSCVLSHVMESWMSSGDDAPLIAQLHTKAQLIGEMLELLADPKTAPHLLQHANEHYGMGWTVGQQIETRRGWLQSAGLMACTHDKRLYRTDAGPAFLGLVEVEPPLDRCPVSPSDVTRTPS